MQNLASMNNYSTVKERMISPSSWQVNPPQSRISVKAIKSSFQPRKMPSKYEREKDEHMAAGRKENKCTQGCTQSLKELKPIEKIVTEQQPQEV